MPLAPTYLLEEFSSIHYILYFNFVLTSSCDLLPDRILIECYLQILWISMSPIFDAVLCYHINEKLLSFDNYLQLFEIENLIPFTVYCSTSRIKLLVKLPFAMVSVGFRLHSSLISPLIVHCWKRASSLFGAFPLVRLTNFYFNMDYQRSIILKQVYNDNVQLNFNLTCLLNFLK